MDRVILHCDLNNFYASVETILHPEYKGKPIAVCGDPKKRHGIVLAKSQPAKIMGVKTGDTVWQAQQKCPDITIVPPTFREYVKYSDIVFKIYTEYTDRVEHFGMDECWLDVTGSVGLFGDGKKIADTIRKRVYDETGLTISVGVSWTKSFAKLGSDMKKPDATTVISRENYKTVVWNLPVGEMIYIGRSSVSRLKKLNINTLGELANADRALLKQHFGIAGDKLIDAASGNEKEPVKFYYDVHIPKSVGHGTTTTKDVENFEQAKIVVYALSEMVATRLRKYNLVTHCVSVGLRNTSLEWFSRQVNLIEPVNNASDIAYPVDVALMNQRDNALVGENLGWRLETIVYLQLIRTYKPQGYDIYYLSDRSGECDFVVCKNNQVKQAIQVSYDISSPKTRKREIDGLLLAHRKTQCTDLLLLTDHEYNQVAVNGQDIKIQPVYDWVVEMGKMK